MDERKSLSRFINLHMPQHRAPVIESLRLDFSHGYTGSVTPEDVKLWVALAVTRSLRELRLDLYTFDQSGPAKMLVILKLKKGNLVDVPRTSCLPSLKTLLLQGVTYADQKSLHRLLSSCPVLEDLFVEQDGYENDQCHLLEAMITLMPKLEEMEVDSTYLDTENFVSLITYVKRLSLCLPDQAEKALYREGLVLNQLRHLKLCSCTINWSKLLVRLLNDSPKLQELEIHLTDDHTNNCKDPPVCWENQLTCVPECLLSSLETFKWTGIYGSQKEVDLVKYVLRNARCLKTASILFRSSDSALEEDELEMVIQDLSLSSRGSKDVKLIL
ncbi:hypothetical protein Bca4012_023955 [Brassica carinata]